MPNTQARAVPLPGSKLLKEMITWTNVSAVRSATACGSALRRAKNAVTAPHLRPVQPLKLGDRVTVRQPGPRLRRVHRLMQWSCRPVAHTSSCRSAALVSRIGQDRLAYTPGVAPRRTQRTVHITGSSVPRTACPSARRHLRRIGRRRTRKAVARPGLPQYLQLKVISV